MVVQDSYKKFIIRADTLNNIIYETCIDSWNKEVYERYHESYINNVLPLFCGLNWVKCCDLRSYHISDITDELKQHTRWAINNGMLLAIFITNSSIVKLQLKKVFKGNCNIKIFETFDAAEKFINNALLSLH